MDSEPNDALRRTSLLPPLPFYTVFSRLAKRFLLLRCGKLIAAFCHRTLAKIKKHPIRTLFILVGEGGFGPPKSVTTDLQSAPFGRSGNLPCETASPLAETTGAGGRIWTPDLLITNQLLYRLSYTGVLNRTRLLYYGFRNCQALFSRISFSLGTEREQPRKGEARRKSRCLSPWDSF